MHETTSTAPDLNSAVYLGDQKAVMSLKEWLWLAATATGLIIVYLSPLRDHLSHLQDLNRDIKSLGHTGPLVFVLVSALITSMGFPRMILYPVGGMAFGFIGGMAWCLCGSLIGAYLSFCYARWAGRAMILAKWPGLSRVTELFEHSGAVSVALVRQLPSPGFLTNLVLGISPVSHGAFLIGTAVGSLPSAIPATLIGSSTIQTSAHHNLLYITVSLVFLIILWAGFSFFFHMNLKARVSSRTPLAT